MIKYKKTIIVYIFTLYFTIHLNLYLKYPNNKVWMHFRKIIIKYNKKYDIYIKIIIKFNVLFII